MPKPVIVRPSDTVSLKASDPVFAHGFGLFETIALKEGRLCFWSQHWRRLMTSAEAFGLECVYSEAETLDAVAELVCVEGLQTCAIKLSLVRLGFSAELFVSSREFQLAPPQVSLSLSRAYPINEASLLAGHKTHNYMENVALLEQCRKAGHYDTVRLDSSEALAETTMANLFCYLDGALITPALQTGILPGVIRGEVLRLASSAGIRCEEGVYTGYALENAECVFLTNSLQRMVSVGRVEGEALSLNFDSQAHPLFEQLGGLLAESERASAISF